MKPIFKTLFISFTLAMPLTLVVKENTLKSANALSGYQIENGEVVSLDFDKSNSTIWAYISNNDYTAYPTTSGYYNTIAQDVADHTLNTLDKIQVNGQSLSNYVAQVKFNKYQRPYLGFELNSAGTNLTANEFYVPAGTEFPSFSTIQGTNKAYVTTRDVTFQKVCNNFGDYFLETVDVDVIGVLQTNLSEANSIVSFALSETDYSGQPENKHLWATDAAANRLKILPIGNGITYNGSTAWSFPAGKFNDSAEPMVNFSNHPSDFAMRKSGNTSVNDITIPKGSLFPSYGYTFGENAVIFRTKSTVKYVNNGTGFVPQYDEINTVIDSAEMYNQPDGTHFVALSLANSDYAASTSNNFVTLDCLSRTNFATNIKINGATVNQSSLDHYVKFSNQNKFGFKITTAQYQSLKNITIPAGTTFPTYKMVSGENIFQRLVTTQDITLNFHNDEFTKDGEKYYIDNDILRLSSSGSGADKSIDFILESWDWPGKATLSNYVLNSSASLPTFNTVYNTHSKVHAYDANDNELTFTSESFINVWGGDRTFALRLLNADVNFSKLKKVYIEKGCEFPTYAGFEATNKGSSSNDGSVYKTTKDQYFYYENGVFVEGSKYHETTTSVTAVEEVNSKETNSFFRFKLTNSDYQGVSATTNIATYSNKLNDLNTTGFILINGKPLSSDTVYPNSEKFINLFGENSTYSFRTTGNQTGCYYESSSVRYETEDLSVYEIIVMKGCQFPSYAYITGQTSSLQCYVADRDYVFVYFDGRFVLSENLNYPQYEDTSIKYIGMRDKGTTNKSIDFVLNNFDWPNAETISDIDIRTTVPCDNLNNRILIIDKNNQEHLIASKERFINVWDSGSTPLFSLRNPLDDISNVKYVRIYKGAEFPSYSAYLGESTLRYRLENTTTYYADLDGAFYLGSGLTIEQYAINFADAMGEICANYDGVSSNKTALEKKFYAFQNIYQNEFTQEQKQGLLNSEDSDILEMLERYEFVVGKYGLTNFLNVDISTNPLFTLPGKSGGLNMIIVAALSASLIATGSYLMLRKRKGER